MSRRGLWRLLGTAVLVGAGLHATLVPAGAVVAEPDVGWWWAGRPSHQFPVIVEPRPEVPPGGFYVASTPSGTAGLSALRYEWPEGMVEPVLTLTIAEAVGTPAINACVTAQPWDAVDGGPWDQRPTYDCAATFAEGVTTDDGTGITFDLSSFVPEEHLDVVLVPRIDPLAPAPPTFSVSFERPEDGSLVLTEGDDDGDDPPPDGDDPPPDDGDADEPENEPAWMFEDDFELSALIHFGTPNEAPSAAEQDPRFMAQPAAALPPPLDTFPYSPVLTLVLVLLGVGSYLARALDRPVAPHLVGARSGSRTR